jgi:predicted DNA-binding ribbon-helix-helix protein
MSLGRTHTIAVRTRLTAAEWKRIQRLAKARDLTAAQLVTETLRERLLNPVSASRKD